MIDSEGYRPNVGIILANATGQVLWAKRIGFDAWQFPQGGVNAGETPTAAMYRELWEELGLYPKHVRVLAQTKDWLKYNLPHRYIRNDQPPVCVGQKQKWFLLQLIGDVADINLNATNVPEFDHWTWTSYWYPLGQVVAFKQEVYRQALVELVSSLPTGIHQ